MKAYALKSVFECLKSLKRDHSNINHVFISTTTVTSVKQQKNGSGKFAMLLNGKWKFCLGLIILLVSCSVCSSVSWVNVIDVKHRAIVTLTHFRRYRRYTCARLPHHTKYLLGKFPRTRRRNTQYGHRTSNLTITSLVL